MTTNNITVTILVACINANGEADMVAVEPTVTQDQIDDGFHYEQAILMARDLGYAAPFVPFDQKERRHITRALRETMSPAELAKEFS
jgi:hypothetical protein